MAFGKQLSASEVSYVTALSPVALAAAGSTNPVDFSGYEWGTALVMCDSGQGSITIQRSGTSNGTFAGIGASMQTVASGICAISFAAKSSAVWYRVTYNNNNLGSMIMATTLVRQDPRKTPVDQATTTTSYGSVL